MKKELFLLFFLILIMISCKITQDINKEIERVYPNIKYNFQQIKNLNQHNFSTPIYLGNYQEYWIDWSPDGTKIIALAINTKDVGVHILDIGNLLFQLNNQNIFIPVDKVDPSKNPLIWKAEINNDPMLHAFPSWSKDNNIIAYGEYENNSYKKNKIIIVDFEKDIKKNIEFDFLSIIEGIDFSWNSNYLGIYGENYLIIYDYKSFNVINKIELKNKIEQISWFPDDKNILVIYNNTAYKIDLNNINSDPQKIFDGANWSKISFIPNTKELIMGSKGGIMSYNYETKQIKQLTKGVHYQPQVSHDGKWFTYISETPLGGFVYPTRIK